MDGDDDALSPLARVLKALRTEAALSHEKLAGELSFNKTTLIAVEKDRRRASNELLHAYARQFNVEIERLTTLRDSPDRTTASAPALLRDDADLRAQRHLDGKRPPRPPEPLGPSSAPSLLLLAECQYMRFDDVARAAELALLEQFLASTVPFCVIAGPGGAGKTRLMIEVCERMRSKGHIAGFLDPATVGDVDVLLSDLWAGSAPRLIVFDYAESAPGLAAKLLSRAFTVAQPRVHVVLLTRGIGPWWSTLRRESEVAASFDDDWLELSPMYEDADARRQCFVAALSAYGASEREAHVPDLAHELLVQPLYLHALALLMARGEQPSMDGLSRFDILAGILRHERRFWMRWWPGQSIRGASAQQSEALDRVAAVVTLVGPVKEARDAVELAASTCETLRRDHLEEASECLQHMYPARAGMYGIRPLEPDPLGEQLIYEMIHADGDRFTGWSDLAFHPQAPASGIARTVEVVERLARAPVDTRRAEARRWLTDLLLRHGPHLIDQIIEEPVVHVSAPDRRIVTISPLHAPELDTALASALEASISFEAASTMLDRIPEQTFLLLEVAISAARIVSDYARSFATPDVSGAMQFQLALRLGAAGRHHEAVDAAREAIDCYETLVEAEPARALPRLVSTTNALANALACAGKPTEALAAAEAAKSLCDSLAEMNLEEHEEMRAVTFNNLGNRLYDVGRTDEALTCALEATRIRWNQAQKSAKGVTPELASALNNLSIRLSKRRRIDEATSAARQAVAIYRELVAEHPDAYLSDLAMALNTLGVRLSSEGRHDEALEVTREAVELRRRLVQQNKDAFQPQLAGALSNMGSRLVSVGRKSEALSVAREAVASWRELVRQDRDAHVGELANALDNLGNRLGSMEMHDDALAVATGTLVLRRELAAAMPDAHRPELVRSLNNRGLRASAVGRHDDAVASCEEALRIARDLAEHEPLVRQPQVIRSLVVLARVTTNAGRLDEAFVLLHDAQEAVASLGEQRPVLADPLVEMVEGELMRLHEALSQPKALGDGQEDEE